MSLTPLHQLQSACSQTPVATRLLGEKVAITLMIMGTFFLVVPLVIWRMHGIFPDQNVSIVLGVIGIILLLVSILLKARSARSRLQTR